MKLVPWQRAVITALAGGVLVGCGGSSGGGMPAAVTTSERVWIDDTRGTPASGANPSISTRTLRVRFWLSASRRPQPLLVMAHGFGGAPEKFDAFAHTVATAGYVVAAPAFPLTNADAPGGHQTGLRDYVNQPGDVSFAITQILDAAAQAGDPLHGSIDRTAIAVLGHSLGGTTVLGLTRKACCRDDRIAASVLVAAESGLATGYGPDPIAGAGPATLIVSGTADQIVGFRTVRVLYALFEPPRFLVGLQGAGHSESVESQAEPPIVARDAAQRAVIAFLDAQFRGQDRRLERVLSALDAEGHIVEAEP